MPVHSMSFESGVFFSTEEGTLTADDAQAWADAARQYAEASLFPIVALIDARAVRNITRAAGMVFSEAAKTPNLYLSCVVTGDPVMYQVSQSIGLRGKQGGTYVFQNMEEAQNFAYAQAQLLSQLIG